MNLINPTSNKSIQEIKEDFAKIDWKSNDLDDDLCENAKLLYFGSWSGNYSKSFSTENFYDSSLNNYSVQGVFNFTVDEDGEISGSGSGSISASFGLDKGSSTVKKTTLKNPSFTFNISGEINCTTFSLNATTTSKPPTNYYEYFDNQLGKTGESTLKLPEFFYLLGLESTGYSIKVNPITLKASENKTKNETTYKIQLTHNDE